MYSVLSNVVAVLLFLAIIGMTFSSIVLLYGFEKHTNLYIPELTKGSFYQAVRAIAYTSTLVCGISCETYLSYFFKDISNGAAIVLIFLPLTTFIVIRSFGTRIMQTYRKFAKILEQVRE